MTAILGLLLLGLMIALQRAVSADKRAARLEDRLRAMEDRLRNIELRLEPAPPMPDEAASATAVLSITVTESIERVAPPIEPVSTGASAAVSPSPAAARAGPSLEELIGGRWLLFAGIAAIILGVSYFVKFAFDNGWISEPLRVSAGVVTGLMLIGGGTRFRSRGLPLFGQGLAGAGIVVLYVSIYAALHFYALIPESVAFASMVIVTGAGAYFADREGSQPLASLALVGGFATPLLVSGERNAQIVLFTYMGILIGGAAVIARRHTWPLIGAASYLCTFVLVVIWFFASYDARVWLRTELFLTAYLVLFAYLLDSVLRSPARRSPQSQLAAAALATAPIVYHVASVFLLAQHTAAWLIYVVVATLAGLIVAQRSARWMRILVLLLVGLPMLAWLSDLSRPNWYGPAVATVVALYLLHLATQLVAAADESQSASVSAAHVQLNGLLMPLTLYAFFETRHASWNPWMTAGMAAWNAFLAFAASRQAPRLRLQFFALAATLAAVSLVLAFDGPALAVGWSAEGVLVGWLALRERRRSLAIGSTALIILGALQIMNLLALPLPAADVPFFNSRALAALLVIGMLGWLAWRLREDGSDDVLRTAIVVLANLLALAFVSADLHAHFAQQAADASIAGGGIADARLAEQVALSVTWALYALALVFAGIRRRFPAVRYLGIGLFGIVVAKVLAVDIAGLDRFYRMLSVLGVGVLLLIASYLYQRSAADRTPHYR
jgi:uncharacterized membrane protein